MRTPASTPNMKMGKFMDKAAVERSASMVGDVVMKRSILVRTSIHGRWPFFRVLMSRSGGWPGCLSGDECLAVDLIQVSCQGSHQNNLTNAMLMIQKFRAEPSLQSSGNINFAFLPRLSLLPWLCPCRDSSFPPRRLDILSLLQCTALFLSCLA